MSDRLRIDLLKDKIYSKLFIVAIQKFNKVDENSGILMGYDASI